MKRKSSRLIGSSIAALICTLGFTQATIIEFDISPAGSSAAVGLRPGNESPAVTVASNGSGNEISDGISYDTDTNTLSVTLGYGSAAGFTNLTGAATAMHIHGPAAAGTAAPVLFDLASLHFPFATATNGGIIYGSVIYSDAQETALLNNQDYINIHTALNPNGEIRGQLVRANVAPEVDCPDEEMTVECGVNVTYSATVSDFDGDAVAVVWRLNGEEVKTQNITAGSPPTTPSVLTFTTKVHEGTNLLSVTATDSEGAETVCETVITAEDTVAPVIKSLSVSPKVLWPPNGKFVAVTVDAKVKDACDEKPSWKIISVTSNQGDKSDWDITGDHTVNLRAKREGKDKDGRTYTIRVRATDDAGNKSAIETVIVRVPHDQGK